MKVKRILVTGSGGAASSNFINSLKLEKEEYFIIGVDSNQFHLELSPADVNYRIAPVTSPRYLKELNEIIKKEKVDFVHSQPDIEVKFISDNRDKINAKVFLPSKNTINICQDKWKTFQLLSGHNCFVPQSFLINSEEDLERTSKILLKKGRFWLRARSGAGAKASLPVDKTELGIEWFKYWKRRDNSISFIASEYLPGREFAFQSIWNKGEIIVSQTRERLEYLFGYLTPSGQTSSPSLARTVHNKEVNKLATRAILSIDKNATGVFCIDLKSDSGNKAKVTEINAGRFFTTSNFIAVAGCNMPHFYIKMGLGENLERLPKYDAVKRKVYWVRMIDMGSKLIEPFVEKTKLIIFDFDNTISHLAIDWATVRSKINKYLKKVGLNEIKHIGIDLNKLFKKLEKNKEFSVIKKNIDVIIKESELKAAKKSLVDREFIVLLKELKIRKHKIVILSDNSEEVIKKILPKPITSQIDVIIGRESKRYFKPNTEALNILLKKSNIDKKNSLVVGDSKADMLLAKKEGIRAVYISDKNHTKSFPRIKSLGEVVKYLN